MVSEWQSCCSTACSCGRRPLFNSDLCWIVYIGWSCSSQNFRSLTGSSLHTFSFWYHLHSEISLSCTCLKQLDVIWSPNGAFIVRRFYHDPICRYAVFTRYTFCASNFEDCVSADIAEMKSSDYERTIRHVCVRYVQFLFEFCIWELVNVFSTLGYSPILSSLGSNKLDHIPERCLAKHSVCRWAPRSAPQSILESYDNFQNWRPDIHILFLEMNIFEYKNEYIRIQ